MATIKASGGDYTTVALWEADTDNDLTGAGEVIGEIYDVNTTSLTTIAGATNTSSTNFRHLTVNSAYRHAGVWDTGKTNFQASSGASSVITISEAFFTLSYQQVKNTSGSPSGAIQISNVASVKINNCLGWTGGIGGLDDNSGLYITGAGSTGIVVRNSIFYTARNGIYGNNGSQTWTLENCTTVGGTYGVRTENGLTVTIKNHYSGGNTSNDYDAAGGIGWSTWSQPWTATTCACEDSITETGLTNGVAFSTSNFTNVTAGSYDLSLPSGSALIDAGTDLSGSFTIDIAGNTRSGTWDIGAFERVSAGAIVGRLVASKLLRGGILSGRLAR